MKARKDGAWDLRWFAPAHEVDFCGHATLATAHVLLTESVAVPPLVFHTKVGKLKVTTSDKGYHLDISLLPPEPLEQLPDEIIGIFEDVPVAIFRNFENIFVELPSSDRVREFKPDLNAISQLGPVGLVVTGQAEQNHKADFVSRYFAPGAGIPEDPVTGSIHATLAPYWAKKLGRSKLMGYQASSRGGWLDCECIGERVVLVGQAVTFLEGNINIGENASRAARSRRLAH